MTIVEPWSALVFGLFGRDLSFCSAAASAAEEKEDRTSPPCDLNWCLFNARILRCVSVQMYCGAHIDSKYLRYIFETSKGTFIPAPLPGPLHVYLLRSIPANLGLSACHLSLAKPGSVSACLVTGSGFPFGSSVTPSRLCMYRCILVPFCLYFRPLCPLAIPCPIGRQSGALPSH